MPLFADADWVQIVAALIFFVITGLAQFVQKRARDRQGLPPAPDPESLDMPAPLPSEMPPPVQRESRAPTQVDWEDQLRRLLSGDQGPSRPPPPILPPARDREFTSNSRPTEDNTEESVSWEDSSRPSEEEISLEDAPASPPLKSEAEWNSATRLHTEDHMATAANAYRKASSLHELTSARLRGVRNRTTSHTSPATAVTKKLSTKAGPLKAMLRHPDSLRQAILVTTVLQPPKALANRPGRY